MKTTTTQPELRDLATAIARRESRKPSRYPSILAFLDAVGNRLLETEPRTQTGLPTLQAMRQHVLAMGDEPMPVFEPAKVRQAMPRLMALAAVDPAGRPDGDDEGDDDE